MNGLEKIDLIMGAVRLLTQNEIDEMQELIDNQKTFIHPFKRGEMRKTHKIAEHNQRMLNELLVLKEIIEDFEEEVEK
ncbi:hypothetical protein [Listeria ivanovii]|uniref:hypothetical protein n=1 Tax=Listeria ivanovii TaxID=1638 RepID=UPI00051278C1|nr:hypothetical protein [Listeria ivanovii]AIS61344.1 hypothetical protein JL53_00695 [Listeria ivanovii subsp. londoniensis]EDN9201666.1 hypothetical protein [Listeria monocytogenes]EDN9412501.1 hypothetical protein [Listeria monocytogenes]